MWLRAGWGEVFLAAAAQLGLGETVTQALLQSARCTPQAMQHLQREH